MVPATPRDIGRGLPSLAAVASCRAVRTPCATKPGCARGPDRGAADTILETPAHVRPAHGSGYTHAQVGGTAAPRADPRPVRGPTTTGSTRRRNKGEEAPREGFSLSRRGQEQQGAGTLRDARAFCDAQRRYGRCDEPYWSFALLIFESACTLMLGDRATAGTLVGAGKQRWPLPFATKATGLCAPTAPGRGRGLGLRAASEWPLCVQRCRGRPKGIPSSERRSPATTGGSPTSASYARPGLLGAIARPRPRAQHVPAP